MAIFAPCDGGVYCVKDACPDKGAASNPKTVNIDGFPGGIAITGFTLELHTNHQFLHSLNEFIYVFPFGDRIGELTITGLTFLGGGACGDCPDSENSGPCGIFGYYLRKRLSKPEGFTPSKITLAGCDEGQMLGFLTGLRMETVKPELPLVQWVLRYNVIIGGGA
jgi:hypothetical protein